MSRDDPDRPRYDPEDAIGVVYSEHRRRWQRPWNIYLFYLFCLVGIVLVMGLIGFFSPVRLVGAIAFLASPATLTLSDRAAPTSRSRELAWGGVTATLVLGGLLCFGQT